MDTYIYIAIIVSAVVMLYGLLVIIGGEYQKFDSND